MSKVVYSCDGEWSGYDIYQTRKGFRIEYWSRIQGCRTGIKIHVPFCDLFPKDMDMNADWNSYYENGQMFAEQCEFIAGNRCLSKGWVVQ